MEAEEGGMAIPAALHHQRLASPAVLSYFCWLCRVTARVVSCRLEEIDGFFVRNNKEYLALIFEKGGSYLGREVSCPEVPCNSWIAMEREPQFGSRAFPANSRVLAAWVF